MEDEITDFEAMDALSREAMNSIVAPYLNELGCEFVEELPNSPRDLEELTDYTYKGPLDRRELRGEHKHTKGIYSQTIPIRLTRDNGLATDIDKLLLLSPEIRNHLVFTRTFGNVKTLMSFISVPAESLLEWCRIKNNKSIITLARRNPKDTRITEYVYELSNAKFLLIPQKDLRNVHVVRR